MKIKVLQKHIDGGSRGNAGWCPIALAIREQWLAPADKLNSLLVRGTDIYLNIQGKPIKSFSQTDEGRTFVREFDSGFTVQPFEFEVKEMEVQS